MSNQSNKMETLIALVIIVGIAYYLFFMGGIDVIKGLLGKEGTTIQITLYDEQGNPHVYTGGKSGTLSIYVPGAGYAIKHIRFDTYSSIKYKGTVTSLTTTQGVNQVFLKLDETTKSSQSNIFISPSVAVNPVACTPDTSFTCAVWKLGTSDVLDTYLGGIISDYSVNHVFRYEVSPEVQITFQNVPNITKKTVGAYVELTVRKEQSGELKVMEINIQSNAVACDIDNDCIVACDSYPGFFADCNSTYPNTGNCFYNTIQLPGYTYQCPGYTGCSVDSDCSIYCLSYKSMWANCVGGSCYFNSIRLAGYDYQCSA